MSVVHYLPGEDWFSVVRSDVVVMVPATTAPNVLDRLWDQLRESPDLQAILPIVAGGFGQGLESMPPFGVVSHARRLHVLLRGEVHLSVGAGDGGDAAQLSGKHVTTWVERIFDGGADRFTLGVGAAGADAAADDSFLPLEAGIVRAGGVRVGSFCSESAAIVEPTPAVAPAQAVRIADTAAAREQARSGALDAEELATINPNLYLTSRGGAADEMAEVESLAGEPAVQDHLQIQHQESEQDADLQTTGYDHLWDQTVARRVEDAAVRPPEEDELPDGVEGQGPAATGHREESDPATTAETGAEEIAAAPSSFPPAGQAPVPPTTPVSSAAPGQLIDSVPWARKGSGTGESAASVASAAPVPPVPAAATPSVPDAGGQSVLDPDDHDGQTVMRSDLPNPPEPQAQAPSEPRPGTGPLVLARLCSLNHANPPESSDCSVCSQPLDSEPREVRRPSLGTMRISTGEVVELDQSLIIGRQPSVSRVQGRGMPKLVQVTSAGGDISRSHVEVRLEGWHVMLCDLKATNGTVLIRPAQPPRRLGEGETAFLLDGDVAQLGDDVFLRFEGLR